MTNNSSGTVLLNEHLEFVKRAGHGEVLIKIADGVIVHIESNSSQDVAKKDKVKN